MRGKPRFDCLDDHDYRSAEADYNRTGRKRPDFEAAARSASSADSALRLGDSTPDTGGGRADGGGRSILRNREFRTRLVGRDPPG
jgi:hypothetical protein